MQNTRTATNIRSGARSPVAGMLHAVFLLLFMLLLAPVMKLVPMAALAAILVVVALNMAEAHRFRLILRTSHGDRAVLLATFGLTVLVDLTVAIEVGMVLAAFVFMHRMAGLASMEGGAPSPPRIPFNRETAVEGCAPSPPRVHLRNTMSSICSSMRGPSSSPSMRTK